MIEIKNRQMPMYTLAKFSKATELGKTRIVNQYLFDSFIPQARHTKAKNTIISSLCNSIDMNTIDNRIKQIKNNQYKDYWEKQNSILALENFKIAQFPFSINSIFEKNIYKKDIVINGLSIYVNPEIIIREIRNGITYVGAIKFNISKTTQDKIDYNFCRTIVFEYLKSIISEGEKVDFNMIYFYTPLNNNWNSSNTLFHLQIIENTIDDFYNYLNRPNIAA